MAFSIRKYLGIDGSGESAVNHDNKANPLPEELLNRVDKDIEELIALICGGKKANTSDPSKVHPPPHRLSIANVSQIALDLNILRKPIFSNMDIFRNHVVAPRNSR